MCTAASGRLHAQEKFFLKANAGLSVPFLSDLSNELDKQGGSESLGPGYGLSVSLGRTFRDLTWAVELQFTVSFYPKFLYMNEYEEDGFDGDLSHYTYGVVLKRRLWPESERFIPSIGAGLGYSTTNLISGGGKIQALEGIALVQIESKLKNNINLMLEAAYYTDITGDDFDNPFLENVPEDVVRTSDGTPLKGPFGSIEIHAGIIVYLKPLTEF